MKFSYKLLLGVLVMLSGFSFQVNAENSFNAPQKKPSFKDQELAIYAHMKRYGINRDDVAAIRHLYEASPPHSSFPHVNIASEKVLNPGEHYRIEMDEYILTMKVPEGESMPGQWIWPYTNTRTPDPKMERFLKQAKGMLKIAELGWYVNNSVFPSIFSGDYNVMGVSMVYRILKSEERENFSNPEKLLQLTRKIAQDSLPSKEKIEASLRRETVINYALAKNYLPAELVVINGRIWTRKGRQSDSGRTISYTTALSPDRMVGFSFGLPKYDYDAHQDPSTYPDWVKKALAQMDEMIASLRITKVNDDGSPDPFVIERVEPAPLPVREKLPTSE